MELTIGGKLEGNKCPYCKAEDVWFTEYINYGAPNVECKSCGKQWIECPKTKLHIISDSKVNLSNKTLHLTAKKRGK